MASAQSESSDSPDVSGGLLAGGIFPPELLAGNSLRQVRASVAAHYFCGTFCSFCGQNGSSIILCQVHDDFVVFLT